MKQPRHQDYDKALKRICSYPAMVEDLVRTFAPGLAGRLDCSTLRKDSVNWVSAGRDAEAVGGGSDVAQRHGDLVWRIWSSGGVHREEARGAPTRKRPREGWLVLMVECQSGVDPAMVERVLSQCGMALVDYARQGVEIAAVLPVVVYTGEGVWTAPGAVDAPDDVGLAHPYWLLDARRRAAEHPGGGSLGMTLFRVFAAPDAQAASAEVMALWQRLGPDGAGLVEAFVGVLALLLWRLFPEEEAEAAEALLKDWLEGMEMEPRVSEQLRLLEESGVARGIERGRLEGIERGIERGRAEGIERGRLEGIERGIERGRAEGIERGRVEGIEQGIEAQRALLRGQVSLKFGAVTAQGLSPLLAVVSQTEALVRVGGWIIECTTGDELLDRVRSLTNGGVDEAPGRAFE